jgi:hypothetical protein
MGKEEAGKRLEHAGDQTAMKKLAAVAAALCIMSIVPPTTAATVQVRDALGGENPYGGTPGYYYPWTSSGGHLVGTATGGADGLLFSGTFQLEANYGAGWEPLLTYCAEPDQGNLLQTNPTDLTGLSFEFIKLDALSGITPDEAELIGKLWANALDLSHTGADRVETTQRALAFQAIIWELRQDDTIDFFTNSPSNHFRLATGNAFNDEVYAIASGWLTNIETNVWRNQVPLYALYSRTSQDFITTVPEPASGLLMLMGLLVLRRRRRV